MNKILNVIKEYYKQKISKITNKKIKKVYKNKLNLINNLLNKSEIKNKSTLKNIRKYIGNYFDDRVKDIEEDFNEIKNNLPKKEEGSITNDIENVKKDIKKFKGQKGGGFLQKGGDGISNIEDGLGKLGKLIDEFIKKINELKGRDVSGELEEFEDEITDEDVEKVKAKVMDFFSFESPCSWNDYLKCYKQNPKIINDILTDTYTYFGKTIN